MMDNPMHDRPLRGLRIPLQVARLDLKHALRQRVTWVWTFLMPPLFFYFIGTVTASTSGPSAERPTPLVLVAAPEAGDDGAPVRAALRRHLEAANFTIEQVPALPDLDAEDAPQLVLEIPSGLEATALGEPAALRFHNRSSGLDADYHTFRVQRAVYTTLADLLVVASATDETGEGEPISLDSRLEALFEHPRTLTVDVKPAGERRTLPSGFQQAVPGILVMFTLMVLLTTGAATLISERRSGLLRRLASAPARRGQVVLGKWLARAGLGWVQVGFAALAGSLLFDMDWGHDLPMVILVLAAWGAFCGSAGLWLGTVAGNEDRAVGLGVLSTMGLAALGGCWWPIEVAPGWMQALQKLTPSGWTMDALHRLTSFDAGAASALPHLLALVVGAVVLGALAARAFRFE